MNSLQIELATQADVELASDILVEAAAWLRERGMALWPPEMLTPEVLKPYSDSGELFVVRRNGVGIGVFLLQWEDLLFWPDVPVGESAYIHRLAVRRSVAGEGIAGTMILWACDRARNAGRRYMRLDCADRPKLRRVYESIGFTFHSIREMEPYSGPFRVARYEMRLHPD